MRVALTIDTEQRGHPAQAGNPVRELDALAAAAVPATFFVQGRWATAYPEVARRIVVDGHLIANHSHWHVPLTLLTDGGIRETVRRAEAAITEETGVDPRPWFRCPYGDGEDDDHVLGLLSPSATAPVCSCIAGPTRPLPLCRASSASCGLPAPSWCASTSWEGDDRPA